MDRVVRIRSFAIAAAVGLCALARAGDDSASPGLSAAEEAAHGLLGSVCSEFECHYSGVVVSDASWQDEINYVVKFSCEGSRCGEALRALVDEGAEKHLSFSQRSPPAREKSGPLEPGEPATFDLIYEIDPGSGQPQRD